MGKVWGRYHEISLGCVGSKMRLPSGDVELTVECGSLEFRAGPRNVGQQCTGNAGRHAFVQDCRP